MAKLTGVKAVLADRSRLAKWKKNPGLRSKLPDRYLTSEQRLARRMGQEIFPGAGITGFEQARQAKSATDQVYGPQKLALQEQQNVLGAQRQRNAGWWDQYVGQLRAMQAPQANTLTGPDVGAQYGAPAGAATQGVQQAAGGYQQALSSLAAGLLANNVAVGGQRKLESLAGLDAQELGVVQKRGALQKEADLFKQDAKDKIKSGARQSMLEDIAYKTKQYTAEQKAALDAQKAATDKRDKEQRRILTRSQQRETARSNAEKEARAREKAAKKPKKGKDRSQQWDKAVAVLRTQKTPWLDGKGNEVYTVAGKTVSLPKGSAAPEGGVKRQREITPAYAKTHREKIIAALVLKQHIDRDVAARAVDRFISEGK